MSDCVFLDRDGVINFDSDDYIKSTKEWKPIPGSLEAIARLCKADVRVVLITNQSAIGRGIIKTNTLNKIHNHMLTELHRGGGRIDAIFYCPHHPDMNCDCRKPKPGLLLRAAERLKLNLSNVAFVGDKSTDVEAAHAAGAQPYLVKTGKNLDNISSKTFANIPVFDDLAAFTNAYLKHELPPFVKPFA
ncbi:MAG: D-glycero-beta-D-manno-heptose 1,7-bisphosphate 7-phosphatase [Arenicellales bacterium WSBS_2016_MAG_OTU3]